MRFYFKYDTPLNKPIKGRLVGSGRSRDPLKALCIAIVVRAYKDAGGQFADSRVKNRPDKKYAEEARKWLKSDDCLAMCEYGECIELYKGE